MNIPKGAIPLEGTRFVMLPHDNELPVRAVPLGTIVIETVISDIPEVQALQPGMVVVDVGAFIGDTALIFLAKGCKVFAFEPYADSFACLFYNTQGCFIETFNVALGNGERVSLGDESTAGNLGGRPVNEDASGQKTARLDDFTFPRLDLLKIDVEGFEFSVLAGAAETIRKHRPMILIEANDIWLAKHGKSKKDLKETIMLMGYTVKVATYTEERFTMDYLCTPA